MTHTRVNRPVNFVGKKYTDIENLARLPFELLWSTLHSDLTLTNIGICNIIVKAYTPLVKAVAKSLWVPHYGEVVSLQLCALLHHKLWICARLLYLEKKTRTKN